MLSVRGVSQIYLSGGQPLQVLKDIHFELEAGARCAIVGPSGSGKTTLLGLCAGLDQPSAGVVQLAGYDLAALSEDELAQLRSRQVGFVFQSFQLLPSLTALENVMVPLELQGKPGARAEAEARLADVGLAARMQHYPNQLSGGEQQRVAIARAIAKRPHVLLCDEPTGALDASTGRLVLSVLDRVNRETGTTMAIITHNAAIGRIGDTVLRMSSGEIVERTHNAVREDVELIEW